MSLPWFPACTGSVVAATRRSAWSKGSPCPEYVAHIELTALHYAGLLEHESLTRLARGWGRGNRWSRRVISGWSAWYADLNIETRPPLPSWVAALIDAPVVHSCPSNSRTGSSKESHKVASSAAPVLHRVCTGNAPRARSYLIEGEVEGEVDPPSPPHGADPPSAPWPTYRVDPSSLTEADLVGWGAYRRHLSPRAPLTRKRLGILRQRIAEHGLDRWVALCDWLATSQHDRAKFLRKRGDPATAMRPDNVITYLGFVDAEGDRRAARRRRPTWVPDEAVERLGGLWFMPDGSAVIPTHQQIRDDAIARRSEHDARHSG